MKRAKEPRDFLVSDIRHPVLRRGFILLVMVPGTVILSLGGGLIVGPLMVAANFIDVMKEAW